ncbi:MAG: 16S rRNA (cytidine(1402)-2'-O)-methyltransferase [Methylococcaceae bacterium]|nr:16S rRNA (cytidine(1402)-2'-O)-methyltransferase [Methylococcaceae bacterium]
MPSGGILYLVATPIGNLDDISARALRILQAVDFIAAEDTRHSRALLDRYGIARPLVALHEHNEDRVAAALLERIAGGESAALISDAGTPLINDPGYPLVSAARARGLTVSPIPGPCALIAALSASGLATDRFAFEGFPPRHSSARRRLLTDLKDDSRTLVFYESSHRILAFCEDIGAVLPNRREVVIARELTKLYETIVTTRAADAAALVRDTPHMEKGEFVVMIAGAEPVVADAGLSAEQERVLRLLLEECSVKTAAALTARITGARRETAYQAALVLKQGAAGEGG